MGWEVPYNHHAPPTDNTSLATDKTPLYNAPNVQRTVFPSHSCNITANLKAPAHFEPLQTLLTQHSVQHHNWYRKTLAIPSNSN